MELPHDDLEKVADVLTLLDYVADGLKEGYMKTMKMRKAAGHYALAENVNPKLFELLSKTAGDTSSLVTTASAGLDQAQATFKEVALNNGGAE